MKIMVICSECGRELAGTIALHNGWHVRKHKNPATGKPCWGARRTNHKLKGHS